AVALGLFAYFFGILLFASYWLLRIFIDRQAIAWRKLITVTVAPSLAALVIFTAQVMVNRAHYANVPLEGSGFLTRTGLDGSSQYYAEHTDLIYGRNVARLNFPVNRGYLFTWRSLFIAGCFGILFLLAFAVNNPATRPLL